MIPLSDTIQQIKGEVNLLDLLRRFGLHPNRIGRNYKSLCPFHEETTPSFTVNISKGYFKCFGCDWSGDAIGFVKDFMKTDTISACKELISMYALNIQIDGHKTTATKKQSPKKTTKQQGNPKEIPLILPHLKLATFPDDYKVHSPNFYQSKHITKEDRELGAKYKRTTSYIYSQSPKSYKIKIELFDENDIRIKKTCEWWHKTSVNDDQKGKGDYKGNCYRIEDAIDFGEGKIISICEGEKDVETLRQLGLVAISFDSSDFTQLAEINCDGFVIFGDNDEAGKTKLEKAVKACYKLKKPSLAVPIQIIWKDAPEKADITNYIEAFGLNREDLVLKLSADAVSPQTLEEVTITQKEPQSVSKSTNTISINLPDEEREQFYTEEAINELFADGHYCSISGKLYKFIKTHYQEISEAKEKRRIADWLRRYSHKLATRDKVGNVWDWVLIRFAVSHEDVNPIGLNLLNGVLRVTWDDHNYGSVILEPHSPKTIFTYVSEIIYNPDADSQDCDRLLSCLEPFQQKIFLQTIASSLDLGFIRKHQGRIRALLLSGKGNNGKDTLREVTNLLLSQGMTDATLGDFQQYDSGRKFPLSKLHGKLISWASENSALNRLDALQSLKAAITGDPISIEFKQQEEFSIKPKTIFIFNANEPPQIKTGLEAMKSRWAIIDFKRTYSDRPNKALGDLQSDPRFKNDPDFLKQNVAPAFLNRIIEELSVLAINGIDYAPVQESFEDLRRESNHLYQFCSDVGIDYVEGGKIYISELWNMLRNWYIANGTLEIEVSDRGKEKQIWNDQPKKGDSNVKAQNQVYKRFLEIFPNIVKDRETFCEENKGKYYLHNIGQIASLASLVHESSNTASPLLHYSEAVSEATNLVSQSSEASEANWGILFATTKTMSYSEKIKIIEKILTPDEWGVLLRGSKGYCDPSPVFEPGQLVLYKGKRRKVIAATHSHVQLDGEKYAIHFLEVFPIAS